MRKRNTTQNTTLKKQVDKRIECKLKYLYKNRIKKWKIKIKTYAYADRTINGKQKQVTLVKINWALSKNKKHKTNFGIGR